MQTIVDHHHASDQRQATKVRFSEPGDEESEAEKVSVMLNGVFFLFWIFILYIGFILYISTFITIFK